MEKVLRGIIPLVLLSASTQLVADVHVDEPIKNLRQVCGTVVDPMGLPIANAEIVLLEPGVHFASYSVTSSQDGTFRIENFKPGEYNLVVSAKGFRSGGTRLTLKKRSTSPGCKRKLHVKLAIGLNWSEVTETH